MAQCKAAGVPCFVKQLGARPVGCLATRDPRHEYEPDYCDADEASEGRCPGARCQMVSLKGKGGDPSEWPEDLRVREFPQVSV